jgi:hypothetical protein
MELGRACEKDRGSILDAKARTTYDLLGVRKRSITRLCSEDVGRLAHERDDFESGTSTWYVPARPVYTPRALKLHVF